MINQMSRNENTQNQFSNAFKELQLGKLLCKANITKNCGVPAYEVFQFLLLLVFQDKNLFRFLNSKRRQQAVSKNTCYSFVPVGFNLLSSAKKNNLYQEISDKIDRRTNGYKARKESLLAKPDAALLLIQRALNAGIKADYVLMDTWFTTEPVIKSILTQGLDVTGMVKQLTQRYNYRGISCTLPELKKYVRFDGAGNIPGSLCVSTKGGIPVKIVFVRNRNKKSECLYLLSTDCSLPDTEIVRIYGNRWSIECFLKASKSFLKLGTEFQSRTYDAMVSHIAVVFTRYTILEWIRRNENDEKTYGELFFMLCEDFRDMDLVTALQSLMSLFVEHLSALSADITVCIKSKVMNSQSAFIQALFGNICWES